MVSAKPTLKYKVREPDAREPDRGGGPQYRIRKSRYNRV